MLQTAPLVCGGLGKQIVCVARNYVNHCKELQHDVPSYPHFFFKPYSCVLFNPEDIYIPSYDKGGMMHYEAELAVIFKGEARDVTPEKAKDLIAGVTVAMDITARDMQNIEKSKGTSWTISKGQRGFCPLGSEMIDVCKTGDALDDIDILLERNGEVQQRGNTRDMIFKIPDLISYVSSFITLFPGDILLTGTPEGVGPFVSGDHLRASICTKSGLKVEADFHVKTRKEMEGVKVYDDEIERDFLRPKK